LILNPDTLLYKGTIDELVKFLDKNRKAAVVAPNFFHKNKKLFKYQGSQELTPFRAIFALSVINKLFPNNPISRKYYLKDLDNKRIREVDSVPGSCFMIRKSVFDRVGGFDENFFLYFEEADIFKRIKELEYTIHMIPSAKVVHLHKKTTPRSKKTKKIFEKSRYLYFRKHFGLIKALVVEGFLRFTKYHLLLFIILALAVFLRSYKLQDSFAFNGEIGDNLLDIKNYYLNREIPLVGPPTSHPWLYFGPFFYWLYGPILIFSGFNPISHAYFGLFISLLTVIVNYIFTKRYWGVKVALLSSLLITISPLYLSLSLMARFFNFVALLIYPLLYFIIEYLRGKKKYLFWTFLVLGSMFSFHYSPIILIPIIYILIIKSKKEDTFGLIKKSIAGLIFPLMPLLIYDTKNGFIMFTKLFLWIPYRIAGFVGIIPKNNLTSNTLENTLEKFSEFIGFLFVSKEFSNIYSAISIIIVIFTFIYVIGVRKFRNSLLHLLPAIILLLGFIPLFIHGEPPFHYFLPLLPLIPLMLSIYIFKIIKKGYLRLSIISVIIVLILVNAYYLVVSRKLFSDGEKNVYNYELFYRTSKLIINDAKGKNVYLKRKGKLDEHKGDFAQNYQYLMWWMGNEPVKVGKQVIDKNKSADFQYTIIEDISGFIDQLDENTLWVDNIAIRKKVL
jgi:hypothetical protein